MPRPTRPTRNVRVRSTRLEQLNASQLALAVWLLARQIVEDETDRPQPGPDDVTAGPDDEPKRIDREAA